MKGKTLRAELLDLEPHFSPTLLLSLNVPDDTLQPLSLILRSSLLSYLTSRLNPNNLDKQDLSISLDNA